MYIGGYNIAFVLHAVIETPAAMNFMLFPSRQIGSFTPQAHPLIRQYALLLLSSVLISVAFTVRPADDLTGMVAGCFSIYHVGPAIRSLTRLKEQAGRQQPIFLSEAFLYLAVHVCCGLSLFQCFLSAARGE